MTVMLAEIFGGRAHPAMATSRTAVARILNASFPSPLKVTEWGSAAQPQERSGARRPNYVELYQFNVAVPDVPDSDLVPLTTMLNGAAGAQTLYTAVRQ